MLCHTVIQSAVITVTHDGLKDSVVIVTGAAGGLGGGSARRLARAGAHVVLVDRDGAALERVAATLPGALAVEADVAEEAGVDRYVQRALERHGRIDYHHLNAGVSGPLDPLPELGVDDFRAVMDTNVTSVFLGLRAAFRDYEARGAGGAIVVTASIAGLRGSADLVPYHASKHAVVGLARSAAIYGGPLGVRVNAVAPGIVPTELFAAAGSAVGGGDDMVQRATTTPLRRAGTPDEIAAVVAFLLSDDAAYMTGEVVSVDGGATVTNTLRPSGGAGRWNPHATEGGLR